MAEMTTPIDFMHQLMYKLSHTYQDNPNKLNLALADLTDIAGLTQITDWTQLRDMIKADITTNLSGGGTAKDFLKNYCNIDLDNEDCGALIGFDCSGGEILTNDNIIDEQGDLQTHPATADIRGCTVTFPTYSNSKYNYVMDGLYTWWIGLPFDLVNESYGLGFTSESYVTSMPLDLFDEPPSGGLAIGAYVATGYSSDNIPVDLELCVNMNNAAFGTIIVGDKSGNTTDGWFAALDRVLAHELTHAVMSTNIRGSMVWLPDWFVEGGTAELVNGCDDSRTSALLAAAVSTSIIDDGFSDNPTQAREYSVGFIAMRYLLKKYTDRQVHIHFPVKPKEPFEKVWEKMAHGIRSEHCVSRDGDLNKIMDEFVDFCQRDDYNLVQPWALCSNEGSKTLRIPLDGHTHKEEDDICTFDIINKKLGKWSVFVSLSDITSIFGVYGATKDWVNSRHLFPLSENSNITEDMLKFDDTHLRVVDIGANPLWLVSQDGGSYQFTDEPDVGRTIWWDKDDYYTYALQQRSTKSSLSYILRCSSRRYTEIDYAINELIEIINNEMFSPESFLGRNVIAIELSLDEGITTYTREQYLTIINAIRQRNIEFEQMGFQSDIVLLIIQSPFMSHYYDSSWRDYVELRKQDVNSELCQFLLEQGVYYVCNLDNLPMYKYTNGMNNLLGTISSDVCFTYSLPLRHISMQFSDMLNDINNQLHPRIRDNIVYPLNKEIQSGWNYSCFLTNNFVRDKNTDDTQALFPHIPSTFYYNDIQSLIDYYNNNPTTFWGQRANIIVIFEGEELTLLSEEDYLTLLNALDPNRFDGNGEQAHLVVFQANLIPFNKYDTLESMSNEEFYSYFTRGLSVQAQSRIQWIQSHGGYYLDIRQEELKFCELESMVVPSAASVWKSKTRTHGSDSDYDKSTAGDPVNWNNIFIEIMNSAMINSATFKLVGGFKISKKQSIDFPCFYLSTGVFKPSIWNNEGLVYPNQVIDNEDDEYIPFNIHVLNDINMRFDLQGIGTCKKVTGKQNDADILNGIRQTGQYSYAADVISDSIPGIGCPLIVRAEKDKFKYTDIMCYFTKSSYSGTFTLIFYNENDETINPVFQSVAFGLGVSEEESYKYPLYTAGGTSGLLPAWYSFSYTIPGRPPTTVTLHIYGNKFNCEMDKGDTLDSLLYPLTTDRCGISNFRLLQSDGEWKSAINYKQYFYSDEKRTIGSYVYKNDSDDTEDYLVYPTISNTGLVDRFTLVQPITVIKKHLTGENESGFTLSINGVKCKPDRLRSMMTSIDGHEYLIVPNGWFDRTLGIPLRPLQQGEYLIDVITDLVDKMPKQTYVLCIDLG